MEYYVAVMAALGYPDGFIAGWRLTRGCQAAHSLSAEILPCPYREARYKCEVVGPHTVHRWSRHTQRHERLGNGYPCYLLEMSDEYDLPTYTRVGL